MIELLLLSLTSLWTADNHEFIDRATATNWEYVGYTERQSGPQPDGAYALTADSHGNTFILFKQRPKMREVVDMDLSE